MSDVIDLTIDSDSSEDGSTSHYDNEFVVSRNNDEDYECGSVLEATGLVVLTY